MLTRHAKLIAPLCTLLEKRNLSDTARALSLSKSAVSKILKKSREVFDDPLLERQGNDMRITPVGKQLLPKLQRLRAAAAECFPDQPETGQHQGVFTILMFCDWIHAIGPQVMAVLHARFPTIKFRLTNVSNDFTERLAQGDADIAIYLHSDFQFPLTTRLLTTIQPGLFIPEKMDTNPHALDFRDVEKSALVLPDVPMQGEKYKAILTLLNSDSIHRGTALRSDNLSLLLDYAIKYDAFLIATPLLSLVPFVQQNFILVEAPSPLSEMFKLMDICTVRHERTSYSTIHKEIENVLVGIINDQAQLLPDRYCRKAEYN